MWGLTPTYLNIVFRKKGTNQLKKIYTPAVARCEILMNLLTRAKHQKNAEGDVVMEMSTVAELPGIRIEMFPNDHDPVHIHAIHADGIIRMDLKGNILSRKGKFPENRVADVKNWILSRRWGVLNNRKRLDAGQEAKKIKP